MSKRHDKLGIKQTIQKHWMDYVVKMMLAGLSEKEIRAELDEFLATQKQSGGTGVRGKKTYGMAISILSSWFSPDKELIPFRDHALELIRNANPYKWLPYHWAVISASYPFWFNVAKQTGRLFNLQDQITQAQVFSRLKEQYGDRETVARNARYAIRSFVAWGIIRDSNTKGHYIKSSPMNIDEVPLVSILIESAIHSTASEKMTLNTLLNVPAFFPFTFLQVNGDMLARHNPKIQVTHFGIDDELLLLKKRI